jgi:hypothetical protein
MWQSTAAAAADWLLLALRLRPGIWMACTAAEARGTAASAAAAGALAAAAGTSGSRSLVRGRCVGGCAQQ